MSDIPTEIFELILARVPVHDLFKLRSVCKTWRRIIDDPAFFKHHFQRGIGQYWFFHRSKKGKLFLFPLTEMVFKKYCYIESANALNLKTLVGGGVLRIRKLPVPTCNGLILLASCKFHMVWRIWNPFTGESLELGQCDEFGNVKCDIMDYPCCGIGYDEGKDEYKVVRIVESRTYVYSVSLKMWRRVEDFPDFVRCRVGEEYGVFAYGALHWIAYTRGENGGFVGWVVALDLSTEKYRNIQWASEITDVGGFCLRVVALDGCLFLSCPRLSGQFVVWKMEDYGCRDRWVKVASLEDNNQIRPVAYMKSQEQILLHYEFDDETFYWYDIVNKRSKRFYMRVDARDADYDDNREYLYDSFSSQAFPASLVRFRRTDEADERVASEPAKSKRKRNREKTLMRLPLKLVFGDPDNWPDDWMNKQLDFTKLMFGDEEWPENYLDIWMDSVSDGD